MKASRHLLNVSASRQGIWPFLEHRAAVHRLTQEAEVNTGQTSHLPQRMFESDFLGADARQSTSPEGMTIRTDERKGLIGKESSTHREFARAASSKEEGTAVEAWLEACTCQAYSDLVIRHDQISHRSSRRQSNYYTSSLVFGSYVV